jgi:hypothetical protein
MESLITLYTDIFNSMDVVQKTIFIFWSVCVVLFTTSFTLLISIAIKDSIVTMFKRKPRPQRF